MEAIEKQDVPVAIETTTRPGSDSAAESGEQVAGSDRSN